MIIRPYILHRAIVWEIPPHMPGNLLRRGRFMGAIQTLESG
jgi:hypothetical protein